MRGVLHLFNILISCALPFLVVAEAHAAENGAGGQLPGTAYIGIGVVIAAIIVGLAHRMDYWNKSQDDASADFERHVEEMRRNGKNGRDSGSS